MRGDLIRIHYALDSSLRRGGLRNLVRQVTVACNAGASGIAVGGAVWKEAVTMNSDERMKFLRLIAQQRIARLTALCHALAKPYTDFYTAEVPFDWYKNF